MKRMMDILYFHILTIKGMNQVWINISDNVGVRSIFTFFHGYTICIQFHFTLRFAFLVHWYIGTKLAQNYFSIWIKLYRA